MLFFILLQGVNSRLKIVFLPAFPLVLCIIFSNRPYLYKMKRSEYWACAQLCFQGESVNERFWTAKYQKQVHDLVKGTFYRPLTKFGAR